MRDVSEPELWGEELEQQLFGFTTKLAELFAAAKKRGHLRKEVDPLAAATMLYDAFASLIQFGLQIERVTGTTFLDASTRRSTVEKGPDILFHGVLKAR